MTASACLSDTSLRALTLQFKINVARIKVLIIFPWVFTPYYLLSSGGLLHHLSCPSGSQFRYNFHLWALSFELDFNLVNFFPEQHPKLSPFIHKIELIPILSISCLSHCSVPLPIFLSVPLCTTALSLSMQNMLQRPLSLPSILTLKSSLRIFLPAPFYSLSFFINSTNISCAHSFSRSLTDSPSHTENADFQL